MLLKDYLVDVLLADQRPCRKSRPQCPERKRLDRLSGRPLHKTTIWVELVQSAFDKPMVGWCLLNTLFQPALCCAAGAQVLYVPETGRSCKHIHQAEMRRTCIAKLPCQPARKI